MPTIISINFLAAAAGGNSAAGRALLALVSSLALVSACATTGTGGSASVEQRAQARWEAVLARDYDTAYTFLSPGYRSSVSRVDFEIELRTRRIAWTSAEIQSTECEDNACTVNAKIGYQIGQPLPGVPKWNSTRIVHERWVKTGGNWWYVPEE